MFENIDNEDVLSAISDLNALLGVKEPVARDKLIALLDLHNVSQCIALIAEHLGLPIVIELSYVPAGPISYSSKRFDSKSLVITDASGKSVEGITAQVQIPGHLPPYGSKTLEGYPIQVLISENCLKYPDTFIAVIAHELSHVLLQSLNHSQSRNELYADLTPILLGFSDIIAAGRVTLSISYEGSTVITHTTKYGYLTDKQFNYAFNRVAEILKESVQRKINTMDVSERLLWGCEQARRMISKHAIYLEHIDKSATHKIISPSDAARIVRIHNMSHTLAWETQLHDAELMAKKMNAWLATNSHHTSYSIKKMEIIRERAQQSMASIEAVIEEICEDMKVLSKYSSFLFKLKNQIGIKPRLSNREVANWEK